MTMTPEQKDRVRAILANMQADIATAGHIPNLAGRIGFALAALDGEAPQEEWTAEIINAPGNKWVVRRSDGDMVFIYWMDEALAKRVAALPKLERAAREAEQWLMNHGCLNAYVNSRQFAEQNRIAADLRAALNGEPKP